MSFSQPKHRSHLAIAGVGLLSLGLAAGLTVQRVTDHLVAQEPKFKAPAVDVPVIPPQVAKQMGPAKELSVTFRHIAKQVIPGVVVIESRGKVQTTSNQGQDSDEGSPFGELFQQNPELKEFFKRRGQSPQAPRRSQGQGSGFVIDPSGVILTNNHVVADAETVRVRMADGREYLAVEVKTDPRADVAIVRIKPDAPLTALPMGDSDQMEIGDWVLAVGSPFGLEMSVTSGIVSAKGRGPHINDREDFLQTDAAINPGNSGGPLLNLNGEVIGINTAISSRNCGSDGVGFAVPVNMARWIAEQLMTKGQATRAYLGVAMQALTNDLSRSLKVPYGTGVVVTEVREGSPAAVAKLEAGDVIIKVAGQPVRNALVMQGVIERQKIGSHYELVVLRDGKELTLKVEAREMPGDYSLRHTQRSPSSESKAPQAEKHEVTDLGIEVQAMTPTMSKQLGIKSEGVVITKVDDDGPGGEAGLTVGLVIEKVGTTRVTSPKEFEAAIKTHPAGEDVALMVRSDSGTRFVTVHKAAPKKESK